MPDARFEVLNVAFPLPLSVTGFCVGSAGFDPLLRNCTLPDGVPTAEVTEA